MSCDCGMAFLCGSALVKVPLLQVGTVAYETLSVNHRRCVIIIFAIKTFKALYALITTFISLRIRYEYVSFGKLPNH